MVITIIRNTSFNVSFRGRLVPRPPLTIILHGNRMIPRSLVPTDWAPLLPSPKIDLSAFLVILKPTPQGLHGTLESVSLSMGSFAFSFSRQERLYENHNDFRSLEKGTNCGLGAWAESCFKDCRSVLQHFIR